MSAIRSVLSRLASEYDSVWHDVFWSRVDREQIVRGLVVDGVISADRARLPTSSWGIRPSVEYRRRFDLAVDAYLDTLSDDDLSSLVLSVVEEVRYTARQEAYDDGVRSGIDQARSLDD